MLALVGTEGILVPSSQNRNLLNSYFGVGSLPAQKKFFFTIGTLSNNQGPFQELGMFPQQEPGSKFSPEV